MIPVSNTLLAQIEKVIQIVRIAYSFILTALSVFNAYIFYYLTLFHVDCPTGLGFEHWYGSFMPNVLSGITINKPFIH